MVTEAGELLAETLRLLILEAAAAADAFEGSSWLNLWTSFGEEEVTGMTVFSVYTEHWLTSTL